MSETLELEQRVREETTVRMSAVVVNRVLPELFGQREEEIFEQLRAPGDRGARCRSGRAGRWHRCSRRPASPSPCAAPARPTCSASRPGCPRACRCCSCPTSSSRSFGARTTRQVAHALGEELGL